MLVRYQAPAWFGGIAPLRDPASTNTQAAFRTEPALLTPTDLFFRGFDDHLPNFHRYQEWAREVRPAEATNGFPTFELVRFMNDHTGSFSAAIDGVNTPELQQADNHYAVSLLIQKNCNSPYKLNTLSFVLADDAQDCPDHVDAHRSTGYVVGPYVKPGQVVSTRNATINMLRTIEDILGLEHLSLHDAGIRPMTDVFDVRQGPNWSYSAVDDPEAREPTAGPTAAPRCRLVGREDEGLHLRQGGPERCHRVQRRAVGRHDGRTLSKRAFGPGPSAEPGEIVQGRPDRSCPEKADGRASAIRFGKESCSTINCGFSDIASQAVMAARVPATSGRRRSGAGIRAAFTV
jgi:hypothetical protein